MTDQRADTTLDALLEFVKDTRGFDFTGYKRPTIQRRVAKRMAAVGAERYDDYVDYLELHGEEFAELFNTILINVTGFFRDPPAWEYLATEIVPLLLAARAPDAPLRVWSAGCASGEEAYTVAMVLARVHGRSGVPRPGQDLRHRRRRGGPGPGAARRLPAAADRGRAPRRCSSGTSSAPTSGTCSARTCGAA